MRREPVAWTIKKVDHLPLNQQREYLQACFACERDGHRRAKISQALRGVTTRVLAQEIRGRA
jgi:hypothetical protein